MPLRNRRQRLTRPDDLTAEQEAELHVGLGGGRSVFASAGALHAADDDLRARQANRTVLWTIRVRQAVRHYGLDADRPELIREIAAAHRHDQETT